MPALNLDMDVLRTLVLAQQLGTLNRVAKQVGRSQSAISQQMRKLEDRIAQPLFRKQGRGLVLTEAGEIIFAYARRILELNDEAVSAVKGAAAGGTVRLGMPEDFAEHWLPLVLGRFKDAHPAVRIEAMVGRNTALADSLDSGDLDIALNLTDGVRTDAEVLATLPMIWIGGRKSSWKRGEPVSLAVFGPPCMFRAAAINALESAGLPWRVAFVSRSLSGLWAAVDAGVGITVRTPAGIPSRVVALGGRSGLPRLPEVKLCMSSAGRTLPSVAMHLKAILRETMPCNASVLNDQSDSVAATVVESKRSA